MFHCVMISVETEREMQLWIEAIKGVLKSRGDETEVFLYFIQVSLIPTQSTFQNR